MLYEIKIVHFLSCQSFTGQQYTLYNRIAKDAKWRITDPESGTGEKINTLEHKTGRITPGQEAYATDK